MLEIIITNCYKCGLETIILNDSQYFWINLKDFEVETECNWRNIFNKHGNSSTIKYWKELTPNIQFQPDRIFTWNDLFERIIKSCIATNVEFLMLNEKLGLSPYGVIYNEEEFILMPEIQDDIEQLKKGNKKSMKIKISEESTEESIKIKISEESAERSMKIKICEEPTEEPMEIKSPKEDENTTDWCDENKFKKILAIINSNKFNQKTK